MEPIFISGNVPSSKNGKRWTGRMLIDSAVTSRYKSSAWYQYKKHAKYFVESTSHLSKPLKIGFLFVRDSKRRFDYHNAVQCPMDMMVDAGWLPDDCSKEVIPVFLPFQYDKLNPGVYISLLN